MSPMKSLTKDQAVDRLMHQNHERLYQMCSLAYIDAVGVHECHMSGYTIPELVSWFISQYDWDGRTQCWFPINGYADEGLHDEY